MSRKALIPILFLALYALVQGCGIQGCSGLPADCERTVGVIFAGRTAILTYPDLSIQERQVSPQGTIRFTPPRAPFCDSNTPQSICCNMVRVSIQGGPIFPFAASQSSINLQAPPQSLVIYGSNIDTTYGMPIVTVYDWNNRLVAGSEATAVAGDGSWLQVNTPNLSTCYSGSYTLVVSTSIGNSTYVDMGAAPVSAWGRDLVDADGDGFPNDRDCNDSDPNVHPIATPDCTGAYFDRNCNGIYDYDECYPGGGGDGGGGDCNLYRLNLPMVCY